MGLDTKRILEQKRNSYFERIGATYSPDSTIVIGTSKKPPIPRVSDLVSFVPDEIRKIIAGDQGGIFFDRTLELLGQKYIRKNELSKVQEISLKKYLHILGSGLNIVK
ncbi:MAG: hypothetical protein PHS92_01980 [Candidatus Gracilibacteria bacterium]|nr:hypothetical protein [Candidatus Gracilibacteria bacterium]